jgi:hypothetical protein
LRASLLASLLAAALAQAAERQQLAGHIPGQARGLAALARLDPTNRLHLAITLPLRNRDALMRFLEDIYDPASPNFRHYLSAEQFAERFGPTPADYAAVAAFARKNGLTIVATHSNRTVLSVAGAVGALEKALHTTLQMYRHPTESRTFYAPATEPSLELGTPILQIDGLNNLHRPQPLLRQIPIEQRARVIANAGSGSGGAFLGQDFRKAYAPGVSLTGSGQTLGLVEFDGYYASDITSYLHQAGLNAVPLQNVLVNGFSGRPGSGNVEVALDIQMAVAMAPGLSKIVVYEGSPTSPSIDVLNRIATDNTAKQISCSWTWGTYDAGTDQVFLQYAAQGQSYLQASGDGGAYVGAVDAPADNPYITVVGGTTLTTTSQGAWSGEVVWNDYQGGAPGGGSSTFYPLPTWQRGISMTANLGSSSRRNLPDVALLADNVVNIADNGKTYVTGGTSVAAPLWAAFIALVNQQAASNGQPTIGFLNPVLYTIGKGPNYLAAFHDVTSGDSTTTTDPNNFYAVAGYDLCTGWGTVAGSNTIKLLLQVANNQVDHFSWASPGSSMMAGTPFTVTLSAQTAGNLTAPSFKGTVSLSAAQTQTNTLFSRDFETGSLSDWTTAGGAYTRSIDTTGAAGTTRSLTMIGGDGTNSYNGLSHTLPNLSPDRVDFYVKAAANTLASGYVVAGQTRYRSNSVFHFRLDSSGSMGLTDGADNFYTTPYLANQWYRITLLLDWSNKLVAFYANNSLVMANIPFCNTNLNGLAVIKLYNFDHTQAWWDQISLTKATSTAVAVTPALTGTFTNGVWSGTVSVGSVGTNITLIARDNASHQGTSHPFNVGTAQVLVSVAASPTNAGQVTGSGPYPVGSQQTIAATPNAGWGFVQWQDGNSQTPRAITVPSTNVTYTATFLQLPQITTQPASQVADPGVPVTFSLTATGPGPLTYLWQREGAPVSNATNRSYTLAQAQASDSGSQFNCTVSNAAGSILSAGARLTVRPSFSGPVTANLLAHTFTAHLNGAVGSNYLVEVSTNLLDWTPLITLRITDGLGTFADTNATPICRFYRLMGVQ